MFDREKVLKYKEQYKKGMIVELVSMDDSQSPGLGTKGVIQYVDDIGQIHVNWETGSTLALVPEIDNFKIL